MQAEKILAQADALFAAGQGQQAAALLDVFFCLIIQDSPIKTGTGLFAGRFLFKTLIKARRLQPVRLS